MNERKLTKAELNKREDIVKDMKKNKRELVKRYGKDAEAVMYGRATKLAKKQAESMDQDKIREAVKNALQNPKKADLNKDGKLSDYEKKRGAAIEKSMANENQGFGSSDMNALLSSMHINLGYPKEFPGLSKVMDAAEDATDFYMDDFPEYETDRDELVMSNARAYARRMFPDFMSAAAKFLEPLEEMDRNDPIAMRLRADKAKRAANAGNDGNDKFFDAAKLRQDTKNIMSVTKDDKKLFALKKRRAQLMRDMEQEAEIEGGPIADRYGAELNKIDQAIAMLQGHGKWGPERDTDISGEEIAKRAAMFGLEEGDEDVVKDTFYMRDELLKRRARIMRDMEQEAEMEGGPIADRYGKELEKIDSMLAHISENTLEEDLDLGHQDNEPHMLKADLYRIGKYAMELYQILDQFEGGSEEVDLPHWWQSKVIKAKDAIVGAKHYLDFEIKEPQIDAMVDVAAEEDVIDEGNLAEKVNEARGLINLKAAMDALNKNKYVDGVKIRQGNKFTGIKSIDVNTRLIGDLVVTKDGEVFWPYKGRTWGWDSPSIEHLIKTIEELSTEEELNPSNNYKLTEVNEDVIDESQLGIFTTTIDPKVHNGNDAWGMFLRDYARNKGVSDEELGKMSLSDMNLKYGDKAKKEFNLTGRKFIDFVRQLVKQGQIELVKEDAINEFDDESMTAYQKAVKKVYRPKYDGSIQMPSQEEVDAFFKSTGNESHYLANKPVMGQEATSNLMPIEPWDAYDYSNWKNITRGHKLNEGVWSLGSAKEIKNIIGILDIALDIKDPQELMDLMDMHDKSMYNMIGDDVFHDDIDGAKRELAQDNLDGAYNRLIDAKGRAKDLLKMVVDREGLKEEEDEFAGSDPKAGSTIQGTGFDWKKKDEVAKKLAKQLKSK